MGFCLGGSSGPDGIEPFVTAGEDLGFERFESFSSEGKKRVGGGKGHVLSILFPCFRQHLALFRPASLRSSTFFGPLLTSTEKRGCSPRPRFVISFSGDPLCLTRHGLATVGTKPSQESKESHGKSLNFLSLLSPKDPALHARLVRIQGRSPKYSRPPQSRPPRQATSTDGGAFPSLNPGFRVRVSPLG